jgi:hypothetical protein
MDNEMLTQCTRSITWSKLHHSKPTPVLALQQIYARNESQPTRKERAFGTSSGQYGFGKLEYVVPVTFATERPWVSLGHDLEKIA